MIKRPTNWDSVQVSTDRPKLPLGAYVCKIRRATVQSTPYGEQLAILFDICEGEHAGFFEADFNANTQLDKKWKGVLRQFVPTDDGSERDEWTKRSFKGLTTSIEKSNHGFRCFNDAGFFDEATLSGKLIGVLFRNEEWEYNGKNGWSVRPYRAISADSVRSGNYTLPADKPLKNKNTAPTCGDYTPSGFAALPDDDGDLPF